jgi:2-C-methyl-D-erythritol 4-phosphate cytidylyltransferase
MKAWAIVVAAGRSRRMGFDKMNAPLAGKPVMWWSLRAMEECDEIEGIIMVADGEALEKGTRWLLDRSFSKLQQVVAGGAERWQSVAAGLAALPAGDVLVAVHDGARPLITPRHVAACVQMARAEGAAASARPVADTVKRVDADGWVNEAVSREGLWLMETPQVARRAWLEEAFAWLDAAEERPTDEVSALRQAGHQVRVVRNADANPKITFPGDLEVVERLMTNRASF